MSTHTEPKSLPCQFCKEEGKELKRWIKGRNDNFKAHLQPHVKNAYGKKKGTRTTYRPEAVLLLKWLEKQQSVKRQGKSRKRKADDDDNNDNVKEESNDVARNSVEDKRMAEIVKKYWIRNDVQCKTEM